MQVSTLGAQLDLGSELVDWYRNATPVTYGCFLIDFSPRTDDWLRYCTNNGSVPSKFCIPERLKQIKVMDDEHKIYLYSLSVPISSPQVQKFFFQRCSRESIQFLCQCKKNLLKGNLQSIKKTRRKFSTRVLTIVSKTNKRMLRRDILESEKDYSSKKFLLFQSIKLHKITRTKLIHIRKR